MGYIVDANTAFHSTLAASAQNILFLEMMKFSQKINLLKNIFFGV
jgi:DNA-binding GntR family transcriptional regulator